MLTPFLGDNPQVHALDFCSSVKLPLSRSLPGPPDGYPLVLQTPHGNYLTQYLTSLLDYSLPTGKNGTCSSHPRPSAPSTDSNLKACHVSQHFLSQHPLISGEGSIHPVGNNKSLLLIALNYLKLFLKLNNGLHFIIQPVKSLDIFARGGTFPAFVPKTSRDRGGSRLRGGEGVHGWARISTAEAPALRERPKLLLCPLQRCFPK